MPLHLSSIAVAPVDSPSRISIPEVGADALFFVISGVTVGVVGWLIRSLMATYSQRFDVLQVQLERLKGQLLEQEKEILRLRAELPITYMRSEDFIRFANTLDAKLDHLNRKMDGFLEARRD